MWGIFGPWVRGRVPNPTDQLPWHNASYKRAPLLEYGEGLGDLMEVEGMLQADLVSKGHRLYYEPAARVHHLNISKVSCTVVCRFKSSRLFAGRRSQTWSPLKRLLYVLASPLIPLVRLRRTLPMIPAMWVPCPYSSA